MILNTLITFFDVHGIKQSMSHCHNAVPIGFKIGDTGI